MNFKPSHIKINGGHAWETDTGLLVIKRLGGKHCSISKAEGWPTLEDAIEIADKILQTKLFAMVINTDEQQLNLIKQ